MKTYILTGRADAYDRYIKNHTVVNPTYVRSFDDLRGRSFTGCKIIATCFYFEVKDWYDLTVYIRQLGHDIAYIKCLPECLDFGNN